MTRPQAEARAARGDGTPTGPGWVVAFDEGAGQPRDLLGGKATGLCRMAAAGLPVPPGFVVTTAACRAYREAGGRLPPGLDDELRGALARLERRSGRQFGSTTAPLLVSVRSGAPISMPGMMDTILNVGATPQVAAVLSAQSGDPAFGPDVERRFLEMFATTVLGVPASRLREAREAVQGGGGEGDTRLSPEALTELVAAYREIVADHRPAGIPDDPFEQVRLAVCAVFDSWDTSRAARYRAHQGIPDDLGTAATVQAMVFGNLDDRSATGVAFTRNPTTGERELYGEFLLGAQGEDVVAGTRTPRPLIELASELPTAADELERAAARLEALHGDMQDIEFTVESGRLHLLQTRSAKRTPLAAVRCAVDLVDEGVHEPEDALWAVAPAALVKLTAPRLEPGARHAALGAGKLLGHGTPASPGAASGPAAFDAAEAARVAAEGSEPILVRTETSPDDLEGMLAAAGILTARGGATSHAAVVARELSKPCVVGLSTLAVDEEAGLAVVGSHVVERGDWLSLDGATGEVLIGAVPLTGGSLEASNPARRLLAWADERATVTAFAVVRDEADRRVADELGAGAEVAVGDPGDGSRAAAVLPGDAAAVERAAVLSLEGGEADALVLTGEGGADDANVVLGGREGAPRPLQGVVGLGADVEVVAKLAVALSAEWAATPAREVPALRLALARAALAGGDARAG